MPFTDKQIELSTTFADQAVIAIENVRLFEEVQARTRDLSESLEQQTATSEVLKVISSSPGELEPVFQAMLENATRICEAKFGNLYLYEDDAFRRGGCTTHPSLCRTMANATRSLPSANRTPTRSPAAHKAVVHIPDLRRSRAISNAIAARRVVELAGARTLLAVPMLKDDELIGAIIIYRQEVRPFTDKQIELVRTLPPRPSSPSRTRGCSTNCASVPTISPICSSRPPPPTFSRS